MDIIHSDDQKTFLGNPIPDRAPPMAVVVCPCPQGPMYESWPSPWQGGTRPLPSGVGQPHSSPELAGREQ